MVLPLRMSLFYLKKEYLLEHVEEVEDQRKAQIQEIQGVVASGVPPLTVVLELPVVAFEQRPADVGILVCFLCESAEMFGNIIERVDVLVV